MDDKKKLGIYKYNQEPYRTEVCAISRESLCMTNKKGQERFIGGINVSSWR